MQGLDNLLEQIQQWSSGVLLRGLARLDTEDEQELEKWIVEAKTLEMAWLKDLLEQLLAAMSAARFAGASSNGEASTDRGGAASLFFALHQYILLAGAGFSTEDQNEEDNGGDVGDAGEAGLALQEPDSE